MIRQATYESPQMRESSVARSPRSRRRKARTEPLPPMRLGAGLQVLAALLWLPQAALIALVIGDLAGQGPAPEDFRLNVATAALAVATLGIVRALLDGYAGRLCFRHARQILSERRAKAAKALAARSPLDSGRPASGVAASILGEQGEAIVPYLSRYRPARLKAVIVPLAIVLTVFPVSWAAAIVLLIAAPLIPVFMALIGWRAQAASEAQLAGLGDMNGFLLDRLRGLATIRAMGAVDATARRLRQEAETLRARTMAVLRIAFLSSAVLELFAALGVAMVAVYIGFHLLGQLPFGAWGGRLSLGEGLFILLLAPAFFEPLRDLSSIWHDRAAGEAALKALDDLSAMDLTLLDADTDDADGDQRDGARAPAPAVRLENLSFAHAGAEQAAIEDFSLSVAAGEKIALFGPSGSGKSTLLALIAGLAPADGGCVRIAEQPLDKTNAGSLRRQIAWIGQTPHIFAGNLVSNVTLHRPWIGGNEARGALAAAGLSHILEGRDGHLGEGGSGLSGGEALRVALARLTADPGISLVLADEPTAHLDSETAENIANHLLAFAKGRTLIVATHDPLLAHRMDRIVYLPKQAMRAVA